MRRRIMPSFIGEVVQLNERQDRVERVMQMLGVTPEYPYTFNINDGARNRVEIGLIGADYGIRVTDALGNSVILANGTIVANAIKTGTLDCNLITVANLSATVITTGSLSATRISGGILDCSLMTVQNLNAGSITVGTFANPNDRFNAGSISGIKLSDGTITGVKLVAYTIQADNLATNSISSDKIQAGAIIATKISVSTLSAISANLGTITAGTINAATVNVQNLNADNLNRGSIAVGYSGQPSQIYIRRNGSDGFLNWEGGNKIWSDGSQYMGFLANGERFYFYTGGTLYALFQRGSAASFYAGLNVDGGGITCAGDLLFDNGEHHLRNIDGLVGANDIRYVLGNDGYYHSFCNSSWNEHAWITSSGSLDIDGNFHADGSKSFRIKHPEDPDKYIQYASVESPEVALTIRGRATLTKGKVKIVMPHHWELVTEKDGLTTIQLTALDECFGIYAPKSKLTNNSFEVWEMDGGESDAEFCWELTAVRKGYKDFVVEPTEDEVIAEGVKDTIMEENTPRGNQIKRSEKEMPRFKEIYRQMTGKAFVIRKPKKNSVEFTKKGDKL
jgi:hypothetical protein